MYYMRGLVPLLLLGLTEAFHGLGFCSGGSAVCRPHVRAPAFSPAGLQTPWQGPGAVMSSQRAIAGMSPSRSPCRGVPSVLSMNVKQDGVGESPLRRWKGTEELPRILHSTYLKTLDTYVTETPVRHALMVWGRKSVGKTRAMQEAIERWRAEGRAVGVVDLKGVKIEADKIPTEMEGVVAIEPESNVVIGGPKGETSYQVVLEGLDMFAYGEVGEKKPVLVIRDVQKLVTPEDGQEYATGQAMFDVVFTYFEKLMQGNSRFAVIVESSEYLWSSLEKHLTSAPQSFQATQVKLWTKEEVKDELVREPKLLDNDGDKRIEYFTDKEFELLWDAVGGHAGEIFDLHCRLRRGKTLEEALEAKRSATAGLLSTIIRAPRGDDFAAFLEVEDSSKTKARADVEACRRTVLEKLKGSPVNVLRSGVKEEKELLSLDYLIKSGVLWEDEKRQTITAMHRGYELAIKEQLERK